MIYTTRQREFDYLQLHWLEKTTGRPSHEWDLYVLKELIDNALDADERWVHNYCNALEIELMFNTGITRIKEFTLWKLPYATKRPFR